MTTVRKRSRQERALEQRQAQLERVRNPVTSEDRRINEQAAENEVRILQDKLGVTRL